APHCFDEVVLHGAGCSSKLRDVERNVVGHYLSWGKTAVKLEEKEWCDSQKLFSDEDCQHTEMVTTQMQLVKKKTCLRKNCGIMGNAHPQKELIHATQTLRPEVVFSLITFEINPQINQDIRKRIVDLHKCSSSLGAVSRCLNVPCSSVQTITRNFRFNSSGICFAISFEARANVATGSPNGPNRKSSSTPGIINSDPPLMHPRMEQRKLGNSFLFLVPVSCIVGNSRARKDAGLCLNTKQDWDGGSRDSGNGEVSLLAPLSSK
ncbi:hypothetical protein QQF64_007185, partial [Cirrhinus molitorella]